MRVVVVIFSANFEVVFLVDVEARAEDILHDDQIRFVVVHSAAVHAEEVGQQRLAVALHYVLQTTTTHLTLTSLKIV